MDIGWLESLLYGLLSGFTEILPVSAQAHGAVLRRMFGVENGVNGIYVIDLAVHLAVFICLLATMWPQIRRFSAEQRLMDIPKSYRDRQPNLNVLADLRLVKTAAVPMLLCFLVYPVTSGLGENFLWLAAFLMVNGLVLYLPRLLPAGNKDSRMLTPLDGILLGICQGFGVLPGISRLGVCASVAQARGADRQYALDLALLLGIPAMFALVVIDVLWIILAETFTLSLILGLKALLAAAAAYIGTGFGIIFLRFLAVKTGFSVFAYYSWGSALFVFILYLMI